MTKRPAGSMTETMIDDENTSITLLRAGRSGEWQFEYLDPSIDYKFEFTGWRGEQATGSVLNDHWNVALIPWELVPAILAHPELDADQLELKVRAKISEALLLWPLDKYSNPTKAKTVSFYRTSEGRSLKECVAIALKARLRNG